jgi:N-acetylneuraminic acid mutarotase
LAALNASTVVYLGGNFNDSASNDTYLFGNAANDETQKSNQLAVGRVAPSCVRLDGERVFVTGGFTIDWTRFLAGLPDGIFSNQRSHF